MRELELQERGRLAKPTFALAAHVLLILGAVLMATMTSRPPIAAIAGPSIVVLLMAATAPRYPRSAVRLSVDRPRALEGDEVTLTATMLGIDPLPVVDVEYQPPRRTQPKGSMRATTSVPVGNKRSVEFRIVVDRWGVVDFGRISVRVLDRFGLFVSRYNYAVEGELRVHVREEPSRSLLEPQRFRRVVGSHLSTTRGEGCEIADIRPYQPGDRLRSINWRISARHDEPWVTLRHPDRSTTVVLIVDGSQTFQQWSTDSFRRTIRATLGLARLHLDAQDPVGMLIYGPDRQWFPPGLGPEHLHGMTDALLDMADPSRRRRNRIPDRPDRLIPPDAIITAISPLRDGRFLTMLEMLSARGRRPTVIEPLTDWTVHRRDSQIRVHGEGRLTWRIRALDQQVIRHRLTEGGATIIPWAEDQPFESVLGGLRVFERARRMGAPT